MVGLVTGAEIYGMLPQAATGRLTEFLNSELGVMLTLTRATTEDLDGGAEVPEVFTMMQHITYVQPWSTAEAPQVAAALQNIRGTTQAEVGLVLRTRISVTGTAFVPPNMDFTGLLTRETDKFIGFGAATLMTSTGQSRPAPGVYVNKDHIMFARLAR